MHGHAFTLMKLTPRAGWRYEELPASEVLKQRGPFRERLRGHPALAGSGASWPGFMDPGQWFNSLALGFLVETRSSQKVHVMEQLCVVHAKRLTYHLDKFLVNVSCDYRRHHRHVTGLLRTLGKPEKLSHFRFLWFREHLRSLDFSEDRRSWWVLVLLPVLTRHWWASKIWDPLGLVQLPLSRREPCSAS